MKTIFGPVLSRRLGLSLGIDVIPFKTCTFDCIYCECGLTTLKTIERKPYVKTEAILRELKEYLKDSPRPDYITLAGSGEPLLNSDIGSIIREIKKLTDIPLALLTNGSLLFLPEVREEISPLDLIVPSLDAVCLSSFIKINRPVEGSDLNKIIEGLILLRKEFTGQIWLEILFVKDVNDSENEIKEMMKVIKKMNPDKVQLNTIDRPPAERSALPLNREEITKIYNLLKENDIPAEIIKSYDKKVNVSAGGDGRINNRILNLIKRRPETAEHIAQILGENLSIINPVLKEMINEKIITMAAVNHSIEAYYQIIKKDL